MPAVVVVGVGAVALDVPPVDTVYQFNVPPAAAVAVNAVAVLFRQYTTGVVTVGAGTAGFTVTTIGVRGLSHATPLVVIVWLT